MRRAGRSSELQGTRVLLVDDDADFREATRMVFVSEGYEIRLACSGAEALGILRSEKVDVVLVDYWMPEMTGEQLVARIREFDRDVQVVLQTGYANERPPREMLRTLDIQGFCDKSEGPEKLLLWTDVAAKAARMTGRLRRGRQGLDNVLSATAALHRMRPMTELYAEILDQATRLAGGTGGILAIYLDALGEDGDLSLEEATGNNVRVVSSTGGLAGCMEWSSTLKLDGLDAVRRVRSSQRAVIQDPWLVIPLLSGQTMLGFVCVSLPGVPSLELELFDLLGQQAGVAVQNAYYYELAALDPLTRVHARRFFDVWARRELRAALRTGAPLALLLMDMDGLKDINDQGGHRAGDRALVKVGRVLRGATREHDLAARYGGDEFAMLLPSTDSAGAGRVAERILHHLREQAVEVQGVAQPLSASMGVAVVQTLGAFAPEVGRSVTLEFFDEVVARLIERADVALYRAKHEGRGRYEVAEPLEIPGSGTERPADMMNELA